MAGERMLTSPTLRRGSDAGEDVERLLRADERGVKLRRGDGRRGGGDEGGQCGERLSVATRRERVERGVERDQSVVGFRDRGLGVGVQRRVLDLPAGDGGGVGGLGRREVGAQRGGALVRLAGQRGQVGSRRATEEHADREPHHQREDGEDTGHCEHLAGDLIAVVLPGAHTRSMPESPRRGGS